MFWGDWENVNIVKCMFCGLLCIEWYFAGILCMKYSDIVNILYDVL